MIILGIFLLIITFLISLIIAILTDYKDEIWDELLKKGGKK